MRLPAAAGIVKPTIQIVVKIVYFDYGHSPHRTMRARPWAGNSAGDKASEPRRSISGARVGAGLGRLSISESGLGGLLGFYQGTSGPFFVWIAPLSTHCAMRQFRGVFDYFRKLLILGGRFAGDWGLYSQRDGLRISACHARLVVILIH
jgi:hypothetical protein